MENGTCKHCGKTLSTSVYSENKKLKSCPNCSKINGDYHVFHSYPGAFGTTQLRATPEHPDGPQSHCTLCRGGHPPSSGQLCCDVNN